jgi:hypothetical protein
MQAPEANYRIAGATQVWDGEILLTSLPMGSKYKYKVLISNGYGFRGKFLNFSLAPLLCFSKIMYACNIFPYILYYCTIIN